MYVPEGEFIMAADHYLGFRCVQDAASWRFEWNGLSRKE
jgi:hypothetical protein